MTAALDRLAVGDHVFVRVEDEGRAPIRLGGLDGVVMALKTARALIRLRGEDEELVWLERDLLLLDRRREKRPVEWRRPTPETLFEHRGEAEA